MLKLFLVFCCIPNKISCQLLCIFHSICNAVCGCISADTGVGGCEWSISARSVCMDVAFWKFSNNPPKYASFDDAMTFLMILYPTCTGPFPGGVSVIDVLYVGTRKKYTPALVRSSGSEM